MTKLTFIFVMCMGICFTANAQPELTKTVVASSGGNFTNGTLTLSSTVAEMTMVTTLSVSGNDLFQGFPKQCVDNSGRGCSACCEH
ncbi:MAG: hypothetical protein IPP86_11925 [Bacteroidetes bacterium]|nr:hypothetical protein [Bacteroidota bacterium]